METVVVTQLAKLTGEPKRKKPTRHDTKFGEVTRRLT